ncbi:hypothetical protein GCM10027343_40630 [Noviherbaspirillum agri]
MKLIGKILLILALVSGAYSIALRSDIKKVDGFCSEMQAGLDINEIARIANKYDVGFREVRDQNSAANGKLGIKLSDRANTWLFVVGAPMTVGEHACGVYHNNEVVLEAKLRQ